MNAVIKDVDDVSKAGRKVDEKPHQLQDSQLKLGATLQLGDVERNWVDVTRTLVHGTKAFNETYLKLSERKKSLKLIYCGLMDIQQICHLYYEWVPWHSEIYYQLWHAQKEVCKSVERSRSIVRSL